MMPPKTHRARKLTAAALLAVMGVFLILPSADVAEAAAIHQKGGPDPAQIATGALIGCALGAAVSTIVSIFTLGVGSVTWIATGKACAAAAAIGNGSGDGGGEEAGELSLSAMDQRCRCLVPLISLPKCRWYRS